jgi:DNA-binding transcriptional MerR regulator
MPVRVLNASEAAKQLGISTKALRLYERRGLIKPLRTAAGWRTYGADEMERCAEIVNLRALGLSLAQIERVLCGNSRTLETALASHEAEIDEHIRRLCDTRARIRALRDDISQERPPSLGALAPLAPLARPERETAVSFPLPWPWGGETFELSGIARINYITGPLFSGKTRLAGAIAEHLPETVFVGSGRSEDPPEQLQRLMDGDAALRQRVERTLDWLIEDGATTSAALLSLIVAVESQHGRNVVIDMVEQGIDEATQEAIVSLWRGRGHDARPLFLLTRSSAILDLAAVGPNELILYCPANHEPPMRVLPYPGSFGYEAVSTCVAAPDVRARTAGVVALRRHGGAR